MLESLSGAPGCTFTQLWDEVFRNGQRTFLVAVIPPTIGRPIVIARTKRFLSAVRGIEERRR
jgi:hypothetical protein